MEWLADPQKQPGKSQTYLVPLMVKQTLTVRENLQGKSFALNNSFRLM